MLATLGRIFFDFVLPKHCASCLAIYESNRPLCSQCDDELRYLVAVPRCSKCSMPSAQPNAPCPHCTGDGLPPFQRVISLGVFNDPLKSIVHRAKYQRRWYLAELMADELLKQPDTRTVLAAADVIVPVPLHPRRQRERGYNQAEVIARRLNPRLVKTVAARVRHTETQTHIHSRAQRHDNLRDAFVMIDPNALAGRNVVLVDDVMTTGATLVTLARTLRPAKPASLSAIVIAVADPKGRSFEVI